MKSKFVIFFINILFFSFFAFAETAKFDQTIITTDGGIEVFQNEKYYNLVNNVDIKSKNFDLKADNVRAYYGKDYYDLTKIIATGSAYILTSENSVIRGDKIIYEIENENFFIEGNGSFVDAELTVTGEEIKGNFIKINDEKFVENVKAIDTNFVFIKNKEMKSYSKSAIYVKGTETLELFNNVKIIKGSEVTTGDYAKINMETNNYSIRSKDNAIIIDGYLIKKNDNKVKLLIDSED